MSQTRTFPQIVMARKKLLHDHAARFYSIFGVPLKGFLDLVTGFDIVRFGDEVVKPGGDESIEDALQARPEWGSEALGLVKALIAV